MKEVMISVEEKKFDFLMELLNSLDFVSVQEKPHINKEVLQTIAEAMKEAVLASQGKVASRPAKEFLSEL